MLHPRFRSFALRLQRLSAGCELWEKRERARAGRGPDAGRAMGSKETDAGRAMGSKETDAGRTRGAVPPSGQAARL
eukprot:gene15178-biopygen633